jgi:hypothetical protein
MPPRPGRKARARIGLLVVFPTRLFTFPTALFLALLGLLRGSLALRSLVLALRLGRLLLMLRGPLLWRPRLRLRLWRLRGPLGLALRLGCLLLMLLRRPLLWLPRLRLGGWPSLRSRCLGGSRPLHLASAALPRLPAWGGYRALLRRSRLRT